MLGAYGTSLCHDPEYKCVRVRPGKKWYRMYPDEQERDIVMRLNRTNMALEYRRWLLVPRNLKSAHYMDLSPLPHHMDTEGRKLLYINLSKFAFAAYDSAGNMIYWGPASGGRQWCNESNEDCTTKTGAFRVFNKKGEGCVSSTYPISTAGGSPMPYCMYYFRGYTIHGSTMRGFVNASHGCIRLFYDDAKWLNQSFVHYGTRVIVRR